MRRQKQEQRRKEAINRYLEGEKIESICRSMRCSKAWLYKWLGRYNRRMVDDSAWWTEKKRIPKTIHSKTPADIEQAILRLRTMGLTGAQIKERLKQEGICPLPSLRTVYRVLDRNKGEFT